MLKLIWSSIRELNYQGKAWPQLRIWKLVLCIEQKIHLLQEGWWNTLIISPSTLGTIIPLLSDVLSKQKQTLVQPVSQSIRIVTTREMVPKGWLSHKDWITRSCASNADIQEECILGLNFLELHKCSSVGQCPPHQWSACWGRSSQTQWSHSTHAPHQTKESQKSTILRWYVTLSFQGWQTWNPSW